MIEISKLSAQYDVRTLGYADVDAVLDLCLENTLFYRYCEERPTKEQVISDMRVGPPGVDPSHKYYVGFYRDGELIAVMDIIDGYPTPDIAYIGFFMVKARFQGKQIGSSIFGKVKNYLKAAGKKAVRLAINKGNPQSTHFWEKNGFSVIREVDRNGWPILVAECAL